MAACVLVLYPAKHWHDLRCTYRMAYTQSGVHLMYMDPGRGGSCSRADTVPLAAWAWWPGV